MTLSEKDLRGASELARKIADETATVIVGRPRAIDHALFGLMTGGHCLFEDVPGLAKTMLVRTIAQAAGLGFSRIQFTPDLLPQDISGSTVYQASDRAFEFRRGPIFAEIVLGDELNRAPPKTQAAMLEAMQEGQVTIEGKSHPLPRPFLVYATQNPIESEGVYILPEAELDRFMLRISMGYPSEDEEIQVLERVEAWDGAFPTVRRVATPAQVVRLQQTTRRVFVHPDLKRYIVRVVHSTRFDERVLVGSSPRGSIAVLAAAKACALMHGRGHAVEDDVKSVAEAALAHRILLRPEALARGAAAEHVVRDILDRVPTPPVPQVAS